MSQDQFIIEDGSGAEVLERIDDALQALATNSSGASAPTTTYAYQLWADTNSGLLKIRNAANNAWIIVGTLADAYLGLLPLSGGSLSGVLNEKQVSIAAATSTDILGAAGNSILMTGNSPIIITGLGTSTQAGARRHVTSTGSGAHILTHNATSLILETGANITVAQGDGFWVEDLSNNNARVYGYHRADGSSLAGATPVGSVVGRNRTVTSTVSSSNAQFPFDDTIPQNTEGTELTVLNNIYTPTNATDKLRISFDIQTADTATNDNVLFALFQDSIAGAIYAVSHNDTTQNGTVHVHGEYEMVAGTTSAITFKIRYGGQWATITINGKAGASKWGGILASSMTVEQIKV